MEYTVNLTWDGEAKVWIATSDEIPGLILEDDSLDNLIQRVVRATPEIIELNGLSKMKLIFRSAVSNCAKSITYLKRRRR